MKSVSASTRQNSFFTERNLYIALFLLLWLYIWMRAIFTQLIHDEVATFYRYINIARFLPYYSEWSANNHILNSLFSYIFYSIFGNSALALRLANILAFPLFFFFLLKIASLLNSKSIRIGFVIVLAFLHNFLEFFALSRGYGLSMAFLAGSLWFLFKSLENLAPRYVCWTLLYAFLALTANLTLLNSCIIIITILIIKIIAEKSQGKKASNINWITIFFLGIVPVVFYVFYLLDLKVRGQLYYGLTTGFWEVTVRTLIKTMIDTESIWPEIFTGFYLVLIAGFLFYFLLMKLRIVNLFNDHYIFTYLLFGNIFAAFLLRHLFEVNYPEDRTGLYFIVFLIGAIAFIADKIRTEKVFKYAFILLIPLLFFPWHFLNNMNLTHNSFENHKIPERFYDKVYEDYKPGKAPPTMGGYKARQLRWAFMNYKRGGKLGKIHGSLYPSTIEDFQIGILSDVPEWEKYYDPIDFHATSRFYLLERKKKLNPLPILKFDSITKSKTGNEYYNFFDIHLDSLAGDTLLIEFDLHFDTKAKPFKSWLVASVKKEENDEIRYEFFALDWFQKNWEGENGHVLNSMIVPLPANTKRMVFYLWNILKEEYQITNGSIILKKY